MDGIIGSIYRTNERNIKDGAYTLSRDCCTEDIVISIYDCTCRYSLVLIYSIFAMLLRVWQEILFESI